MMGSILRGESDYVNDEVSTGSRSDRVSTLHTRKIGGARPGRYRSRY